MANSVSDTSLSHLSEFVTVQMGLHFPRERWRDLERGIGYATREFDFKDVESCIQWLVSSPLTKNQIEILASHLTVGETYFFREKKGFEILEEHILPELIHSRRGSEKHLRIWSAGCCTGEEPYSIAILLSKVIPDLEGWNITILATDINPRFLQKAFEGAYRQWSFRDTPLWIKERYFKKTRDGRFEIIPEMKKIVMFSYLNLAEDTYPSLMNNTNAMDIIFCRNVLMYFAPDRVKKVIQNLYRSLVDDGWLIVSPIETLHVLYSQFVTVNFPDAIRYKKDSTKSQKVEDVISKGIPFYPLRDKTKVAFQPTFDIVQEQQLQVTLSQESRGYLHLEVEEPKTTELPLDLYIEALALYERGRYGEATEKLIELFSHNQETPRATALLARAYANQGKLSKAREWCEKAIVADKLNPGFYYLCATILQE